METKLSIRSSIMVLFADCSERFLKVVLCEVSTVVWRSTVCCIEERFSRAFMVLESSRTTVRRLTSSTSWLNAWRSAFISA